MPTENDLFDVVIGVDSELITKGVEPFARPLRACQVIADRMGRSFALGGGVEDPLVKAVHAVYRQLYRQADLVTPPMHVGAFMFRDVFFPLRIPVIYGAPRSNPVELIGEMSDLQKRWLFDDKQVGLMYFDQFIDVFDFTYGLDDASKLKGCEEDTLEFWCLAKQQLEGAAATLLGSIDKYTVIQNSLIAIELLLKGALIARGVPKSEVREKGHKLGVLALMLIDKEPGMNGALLKNVVGTMPQLVERRYQAKDYSRTQLGNILMMAQFVAGEVLRQHSDRDVRKAFSVDPTWDMTLRAFPQTTFSLSGSDQAKPL